MQVTLTIPDELASQLQSFDEDQLPQIIASGLRNWNGARTAEFAGLSDVLEKLAELPTPEEVLALRPADAMQQRVRELLQKNREQRLTPDEEREWEQYEYVEHVVRRAKAKAALKLKRA